MAGTAETLDTVLDEHDAALAQAAQRCLMAALDHPHAAKIKLVADGEEMPAVELPPKVLRFMADLLGLMGQRQPVMLVPQKHELSTQEAAALLNVSRPFVVKQIEVGRLRARKVGRHRRVLFEDLMAYQRSLRRETEDALQALADEGQELDI